MFELYMLVLFGLIMLLWQWTGKKIATYESVNEAFRQTGIRHISEVARGERKTAGNFLWRYE